MDFDFTKEIVLENGRAVLRPLTKPDLENLLQVASMHEDLVQYSPYSIHTRGDLQNFIDSSLNDRETRFRYPFVIFDKGFNEYAGSTSFANVSNRDKRLEIGWTWIGRKFQKTGLNRNMKFLMLSYAFETLGFERVELKTDERNSTSRTAMEKLGAKMEGILRSHSVVKDGFRRNTVYYSILKSEWPEVKQRLTDNIQSRSLAKE